uniref:hypothetical protein n=1 Tax=Pseudoclavibacter sp. RFBI5 TaxID=2080578 RepID=UPI0011B08B1B|nr:hypothetical protein [Pseudoclavibacter sp. RFBI5]
MSVPDSAEIDIPAPSNADTSALEVHASDSPPAGTTKPRELSPDEKHKQELEKDRQRFAQSVTKWTIIGAIATGVAATVVPLFASGADVSAMQGLFDFLKLVATTALGFVLGKTIGGNKNA